VFSFQDYYQLGRHSIMELQSRARLIIFISSRPDQLINRLDNLVIALKQEFSPDSNLKFRKSARQLLELSKKSYIGIVITIILD
jgi:hypothetical protein